MRLKKNETVSISRLIWIDLKRGFFSNRFKYLLIIASVYGLIKVLGRTEFSFLDIIFFLQAGYDPFVIEEGKFSVPVVWLAVQFFVPFLIYSYCVDESEGFGLMCLLKCKSRRVWWNIKMLWTFLTVLSFYGIVYLISFVMGYAEKGNTFTVNYALFEEMGKTAPQNADSLIILYMIIAPVLVMFVMAVFQTVVAIYTNPMIGMVAVMSVDVLSLFFCSPLLVGNASMVMRTSLYIHGRTSPLSYAVVCSLAGIIAYVAGLVGFAKRDMLMKDFD